MHRRGQPAVVGATVRECWQACVGVQRSLRGIPPRDERGTRASSRGLGLRAKDRLMLLLLPQLWLLLLLLLLLLHSFPLPLPLPSAAAAALPLLPRLPPLLLWLRLLRI